MFEMYGTQQETRGTGAGQDEIDKNSGASHIRQSGDSENPKNDLSGSQIGLKQPKVVLSGGGRVATPGAMVPDRPTKSAHDDR